MNTPVSRKHENETTTVFMFVEVLRSLRSCLLVRHFFRNHEIFITNKRCFLWVEKYGEER